jgi:hypothetical protein
LEGFGKFGSCAKVATLGAIRVLWRHVFNVPVVPADADTLRDYVTRHVENVLPQQKHGKVIALDSRSYYNSHLTTW